MADIPNPLLDRGQDHQQPQYRLYQQNSGTDHPHCLSKPQFEDEDYLEQSQGAAAMLQHLHTLCCIPFPSVVRLRPL